MMFIKLLNFFEPSFLTYETYLTLTGCYEEFVCVYSIMVSFITIIEYNPKFYLVIRKTKGNMIGKT